MSHRLCVYCAGPLFNAKEREEMEEVADHLAKAGFDTFLPQRDGLEFARCQVELVRRGMDEQEATDMLARAIFALDAYQVLEKCDAIVVNLNGRVPDEGAVSEAAMAWSVGKTVVGFKADSRSLLAGADNPLVSGLFGFEVATSIAGAVEKLSQQVAQSRFAGKQKRQHAEDLRSLLDFGNRIWHVLGESRDVGGLADAIRDWTRGVTRGQPATKSATG